MTPNLVYVTSPVDGLVKIGITGNPTQRLLALRKQFHPEIRMLHLQKVEHIAFWQPGGPLSAIEVERKAHRRLAGCRAHKEWFRVAPEEAIAVVREIAANPKPPRYPPLTSAQIQEEKKIVEMLKKLRLEARARGLFLKRRSPKASIIHEPNQYMVTDETMTPVFGGSPDRYSATLTECSAFLQNISIGLPEIEST